MIKYNNSIKFLNKRGIIKNESFETKVKENVNDIFQLIESGRTIIRIINSQYNGIFEGWEKGLELKQYELNTNYDMFINNNHFKIMGNRYFKIVQDLSTLIFFFMIIMAIIIKYNGIFKHLIEKIFNNLKIKKKKSNNEIDIENLKEHNQKLRNEYEELKLENQNFKKDIDFYIERYINEKNNYVTRIYPEASAPSFTSEESNYCKYCDKTFTSKIRVENHQNSKSCKKNKP